MATTSIFPEMQVAVRRIVPTPAPTLGTRS